MIPVTKIQYIDLNDLPEGEFTPLSEWIKILEIKMKEQETESWEHRPWGKYKIVSEGPDFTVKHLIVRPGGKTSIQSHEGREEYWTIAKGTATIVYGNTIEDILYLTKETGSTFHVKQKQIHRLQNDGVEDLHVVEIWKGKILSEEDITRYQDEYGRI